MTSHATQSGHARRVRDWFRKLITFWTLIAIVSAGALAVFADVGEDVAKHSTTQFDDAVRAWFVGHQNGVFHNIALAITRIGSPPVMIVLAIAAGAWFYTRGGRRMAGVVVAAPAVGTLLSRTIKILYGRARPVGAELFHETTYSFPSGHASTSAAVVVTVCYVFAREGMISWRSAILVGGTVPLLVGLTRLYLDVHWTTDVIGGWAVGLFVAAVSAALYELLRKTAPPGVSSVKPPLVP